MAALCAVLPVVVAEAPPPQKSCRWNAPTHHMGLGRLRLPLDLGVFTVI